MSDLAILFGGLCRERMVSVASAQTLAELLTEADLWFWAPDGSVHRISQERLLGHEDVFRSELKPDGERLGESLEKALDSHGSGVTFVLGLHGGEGEDGTVAGWMESRSIPFTGSGAEASDTAFDKARSKELVSDAGVRVARSESISLKDDDVAERLGQLLAEWQKIVLKPVEEGSSYGLAIVTGEEELRSFLAEDRESDLVEYLVEEFIEGTEITCGVVDMNGGLEGLPTVEIRPEEGRFFDYQGKYLGEGVREICPAEISEEMEMEARRLAVIAHETFGCYGYSRTDFIVDEAGPVFLETNTLPGLTSSSLLPQELEEADIGLRDFLERQIELARERYE